MVDEPLLTICIPAYNRADILHETLTTLESEIDPSWEIIISDDCSPDHSKDVIEAFCSRSERFHGIILKENIGGIRNTDFVNRQAKSKYIYTLSDDDQMVSGGIKRALDLLEKNPSMMGVFGNYEEWLRESGGTAVISTFHEDAVFSKGSQLEVLQRFNLIWNPVMRREFFQRHCQFGHHMFGFWPLVDQMLKHGDVGVVTDVFFKHATNQSVPTMEGQLTEGWFHDAYRAGYEYYIGAQFPGVMDNAVFIAQSIAHSYKHAVRFSINKREYLKARNFLLRARAYGAITEPEIEKAEKLHMQNFIAEKIRDSVSIYNQINGVIFEDHPDLRKFAETLKEHIGETGIFFHELSEIMGMEDVSKKYILVRDYAALELLATGADGSHVTGVALSDLFEIFRISNWSLDDLFAQE